MRLLVNTHILLWWAGCDRRLSKEMRATIASADHEIAVSAATSWERRSRNKSALHRDPFDRLLNVQSIENGCRLVTRDAQILSYAGTAGFDPLSA